ncbi:MAG: tRNA uridine(34) 5-carboxymethylaminomethyl modification radical SAM/GNAT enzyme Elp3 [Candidatus Marinimicrobia bacterium]|nr:tRNA uridine(34) 5-carboxymethylaminomethyl modification radical SAM/GNAT enzyme Elp3 [Candidatus Neomarinimicrobiota bacterium]
MLFSNVKTEKDLEKLKRKVAKDDVLFGRVLKIRKKSGLYSSKLKHKLKVFPSNAEMLALYKEMLTRGEEKKNLEAESVLRKIKTKSNSGIVSVSLLTKPHFCPGNCLYCPTEKTMPKSYLSKEPAAARALMHKFNPYKQVFSRLEALRANGHPTDKAEVIIIGGTWSCYPKKYQEEVVSEVFRACNNFHNQKSKLIKKGEKNLTQLQKINENSSVRVIGMSVETRPELITLNEVKKMRELGVTKVEIGVQHLDNKILEMNNRGATIEDVVKATEVLRKMGVKIVYHMMPNLFGSTSKKDIDMFKKLFSDKRFRPDMLKIYPCVVLKGTGLYKKWKAGEFKPYSDNELKKVMIEIKKVIPPYVRIIRVIRDIPAEYIVAGSKVSNLRQDLLSDQKKNNWKCKCIRCREVREGHVDIKKLKMIKREYDVSGGKEFFISFEDNKKDKLVAFLRLFFPEESNKKELPSVLKNSAIVRELHTYGRLMSISEKGKQSQHIGLGKKLLKEAEKMAKNKGFTKISVISGVGARDYYRKQGYRLRETYMVKYLP